jgi:hypothetical protein
MAQSLPSQPWLTLTQRSAWLLGDTRVKSQLKLTSDQTQAVAAAFGTYTAAEQRFFANGSAPSPKQIEHIDKELAGSLLASLEETQKARLRQIALQIAGPEALKDPAVANDLGLTASQKTSIKTLLNRVITREVAFDEELAQKLLKVPQTGSPKDINAKRLAIVTAAQPERDRLAALKSADEGKALGFLTPAQLEKWKTLLGEPYRFSTQPVRNTKRSAHTF